MCLLPGFLSSDDGATAVEYAVMVALIMVAALGGIILFGQGGNGVWGEILNQWNLYIGN